MNLINSKKKQLIFSAFCIFALILISSFYLNHLKNNSISPVNGVLDLRDYNLKQTRVSLAGEWEFYFEQLYKFSDFKKKNLESTQIVQVPNTWNHYKVKGEPLPGQGYATYRVKVLLKEAEEPLSLRIDNMSTSYKVFIDEREVASNGVVGTSEETSKPAYKPLVIDFIPENKTFDLIVQVSNFTYARGGIWYEIGMGTHEQMTSLDKLITYKDGLLLGSLLIMALYYFSFYIVLQKDKSSLYFMILCLIFFVRTSLYGDMLMVKIFPDMPFKLLVYLTYLTLYWIPVVLYIMVDSIYKNNLHQKVLPVVLGYGLVASLLTLVLPIKIYTQGVVFVEIIGVFIVLMAVFRVVLAYLEGQKGAGLIMATVVFILLAGVHDVLYQANKIYHTFGEVASIGIFFLMLSISFVIASRLSDAYDREKILTNQLGESLMKEKAATEEKVKNELAFLKAQIKPHFLYNSLSVITALSVKDPQRTKKLLYALSDYLRGSFNFENYNGMTPLEGEIDTIKAYLTIEKERFQGKLKVVYDIDETIDMSIPLLTIQPLVENALRHGILKKAEGGVVKLSIRRVVDGVLITVEDDGLGISPDKIKTLLQDEGKGSGVGLKNIHKRLMLHYQRGLSIESDLGSGTTVSIFIPNSVES